MTAAATDPVAFATRPARPTDESFMYSSFLRSYRESEQTAGIPSDHFYATMKRQFGVVLAKFQVIVAHPTGNEDEIAGWIAFRGNVLAWVYVKRDPWRRLGVGRLLIAAAERPKWCLFSAARPLHLAWSKGYHVEPMPYGVGLWLLEAGK